MAHFLQRHGCADLQLSITIISVVTTSQAHHEIDAAITYEKRCRDTSTSLPSSGGCAGAPRYGSGMRSSCQTYSSTDIRACALTGTGGERSTQVQAWSSTGGPHRTRSGCIAS